MRRLVHFLLSGGVLLLLCTVGFFFSLLHNNKRASEHKIVALPDSAAFEQNVDSLETIIRAYMERTGVHGLSLAISYNDQLVYAKGFGFADIQTQERVTPSHLFRIASVSKLITAWGIMRLVEEGEISTDDCVFGQSGILKEFRSSYRDAYDISVEHLLTHCAGWNRRSYGDPMFKTRQIGNATGKLRPSVDDIINYVLARRMPYAPGEHYDYSNFGYAVLGRIIEEVSDMEYEEYIKEVLLDRTNIEGMYVGRNYVEEKFEKEVTYYDERRGSGRIAFNGSGKMVPAPYGGSDITTLAAAGGWVTSPVNLLKLLAHYNTNPYVRDFISKPSAYKMAQRYGPGKIPFGWRGSDGKERWWRTGTLSGVSALMVRENPKVSWAVVINTSSENSSYFHSDFSLIMEEFLQKNQSWPDHDLFAHYF
ncbi:serine hydrolase domain-containing protein [Flammeovirgaceae bacterium SG7u.111]|nr:serine hydrolase domain-containing protein [Flammeovirgaceae bacterium SG7u.132]WPO35911.1 serine hydrolase domain-containing protein [Flammeovirgaceae bacterium SG7u.111]